MLLIREVFTAKPGQASKLAKLFKETMPKEIGSSKSKIMTDLVGPYNTVVMQYEVKDLATLEKEMKEWDSKMTPAAKEKMKNYAEMYQTGRREIFRIVD